MANASGHGFHELWDRLLTLLFPKVCVLCQKIVDYDTLWCGCQVSQFQNDLCALCYHPLAQCTCPSHSFRWIKSPLDYQDGAKNAILHLKQRPDPRTVRYFVGHMLPLVQPFVTTLNIQSVVPVPLNQTSLQKKGFNHAELLANALAQSLKLPCFPQALLRNNDTQEQKKLNRNQRKENAQQSYCKNPRTILPLGAVLLVDDVCTTGATLETCSRELLALGGEAVYAITATNSTMDNHSQ